MDWKATDPEFELLVEQAASKTALRLLRKIEAQAEENFAAAAWILERRFPEDFSRPEVQLNLQTNVVQNNLSITISSEEAKQIETEAAPVRRKVREMMATYRPGLGNGNGDGQRPMDIQAEPVKTPEDLAPIVRKAGDEHSAAFWNQFASGDSEQFVDKATAIFVTALIVSETLGAGRGHQAITAFKSEQPTVGDVLCVIDRLCGGSAGQQLLQRKANLATSTKRNFPATSLSTAKTVCR
jgi:hypothetical protein